MSKGNLAYEMDGMVPAPAASSALKILVQSEDGILLAYCNLTAYATLTAAADAGTFKFAPGGMVMSIHSSGANSVRLVWNTGIGTAPAFTGLVS